MKNSRIASYQSIQSIPILKAVILVFTALNALFVALTPLMVLLIKETPSFVIVNSATTIAYLVGSILGTLLTTSLFKEMSIAQVTKWVVYVSVLLFLSFYLRSVYGVFACMFTPAVLAGVINPKLNALIYRALPEEQLATISAAGISTFVQLGMVVMRGVIAILIVICSAGSPSLVFLLLSLLLLVYTIRNVASVVEE
ncbi:hypothetical protein GGG87_05490 [Streptococcus sp. zg-86]|uniref:MFS transporter n=1 Tax=Streptococcus zhangguiae TaxID=2664091 RepID=A0A6I4RCE1_9STRE|nr:MULTISPECIES: hypothetical protein [unclassified Streptococcus]MTB64441.1 hypothetical protein [Streptococcus sp. zg-86]MTB90869.1 hypothetical protein [Streptococcus sp. zg-36]MWV56428.1 hypothetical protein [Streptococcus sp. zg-70]QTH47365.1 hypothetical protein J5M87_07315 [Streptococcus sp. zg-86]